VPSLYDIPGLEPLSESARRLGLRLRLIGGVARRAQQSYLRDRSFSDLGTMVSFLSDVDLVHSGSDRMTGPLMRRIYRDVPHAELIRWSVLSRTQYRVIERSLPYNTVMPDLDVTLGDNDEGFGRAGANGDGAEPGQWVFRRNPRILDSPLVKAGLDSELFAALLFLGALLEEGRRDNREWISAASTDQLRDVFNQAYAGSSMAAFRRHPWLGVRLFYVTAGLLYRATLVKGLEPPLDELLAKALDVVQTLGKDGGATTQSAASLAATWNSRHNTPAGFVASAWLPNASGFRVSAVSGEPDARVFEFEDRVAMRRRLMSATILLGHARDFELVPGQTSSSRMRGVGTVEMLHVAIPLHDIKAATEIHPRDIGVVVSLYADDDPAATIAWAPAAAIHRSRSLLGVRINVGSVLEQATQTAHRRGVTLRAVVSLVGASAITFDTSSKGRVAFAKQTVDAG
jgi:hypothetical protein